MGAVSRRPPISLYTVVPRTESYMYDAKVPALSLVQRAIFCPSPIVRFATSYIVLCGSSHLGGAVPPVAARVLARGDVQRLQHVDDVVDAAPLDPQRGGHGGDGRRQHARGGWAEVLVDVHQVPRDLAQRVVLRRRRLSRQQKARCDGHSLSRRRTLRVYTFSVSTSSVAGCAASSSVRWLCGDSVGGGVGGAVMALPSASADTMMDGSRSERRQCASSSTADGGGAGAARAALRHSTPLPGLTSSLRIELSMW
jgi:hypothetical protein